MKIMAKKNNIQSDLDTQKFGQLRIIRYFCNQTISTIEECKVLSSELLNS